MLSRTFRATGLIYRLINSFFDAVETLKNRFILNDFVTSMRPPVRLFQAPTPLNPPPICVIMHGRRACLRAPARLLPVPDGMQPALPYPSPRNPPGGRAISHYSHREVHHARCELSHLPLASLGDHARGHGPAPRSRSITRSSPGACMAARASPCSTARHVRRAWIGNASIWINRRTVGNY